MNINHWASLSNVCSVGINCSLPSVGGTRGGAFCGTCTCEGGRGWLGVDGCCKGRGVALGCGLDSVSRKETNSRDRECYDDTE